MELLQQLREFPHGLPLPPSLIQRHQQQQQQQHQQQWQLQSTAAAAAAGQHVVFSGADPAPAAAAAATATMANDMALVGWRIDLKELLLCRLLVGALNASGQLAAAAGLLLARYMLLLSSFCRCAFYAV